MVYSIYLELGNWSSMTLYYWLKSTNIRTITTKVERNFFNTRMQLQQLLNTLIVRSVDFPIHSYTKFYKEFVLFYQGCIFLQVQNMCFA